MKLHRLVLAIFTLALVFQVSAQEESGFDFSMDLGLGTVVIEDPDTGEDESWQNLSLQPDFSFGNWGLGLEVNVNFAFNDEDGSAGFRVREEDWIPSDEYSFLELYLPIFRYVRYGHKGDDLFGKIGAIDDFVLGNGFIIGNYSNSQFLPEQRLTGLALDLDGQLFDFPYFGIETFVGNLAAFNLFGTRVYTRPIYFTDIPIIKELQLGFTVVADNDPFYFEEKNPDTEYEALFDSDESVVIYGTDLRLPILATEQISLAAFSDVVFQNGHSGGMIGFGGKLIDFITYGAQLRFLGENFIPVYFDSTYDLYRTEKWLYYSDTLSFDAYAGYYASLGFEAFEGMISFYTSYEGPFVRDTSVDELNPTLTSGFTIDPDVLYGFGFDASYQKKYITNFADLVSAENAVIQAVIGYSTGPATINMVYDLKYAPTAGPEDDWDITTKLETTVSLFN